MASREELIEQVISLHEANVKLHAKREVLLRVARAANKRRKAPRWQGKTLDALHSEIVVSTGDGPFADYVIEFLQECDATEDELRAALDALPEGTL